MEESIRKLKKEKDAIVLAHNYQLPEIQDVADFVGDSLELAKKASEYKCKRVFMCGVTFMAETVAILNPNKEIYIPSLEAVCPLASSLKVEDLMKVQQDNPDAITILYINTEAIAKAMADAICTSANAPEIVCKSPANKVIFGPDKNLAYHVRKKCDRIIEMLLVPQDGGCYVHLKFTLEDVKLARSKYADCLVIVHPECEPEVQDSADFVGSTSQMIRFCASANKRRIVVGTEKEMCYRLKRLYPEIDFIPLREDAICEQMKKIDLRSLYESMIKERHRVTVPENIADRARKAIERMIKGW